MCLKQQGFKDLRFTWDMYQGLYNFVHKDWTLFYHKIDKEIQLPGLSVNMVGLRGNVLQLYFNNSLVGYLCSNFTYLISGKDFGEMFQSIKVLKNNVLIGCYIRGEFISLNELVFLFKFKFSPKILGLYVLSFFFKFLFFYYHKFNVRFLNIYLSNANNKSISS